MRFCKFLILSATLVFFLQAEVLFSQNIVYNPLYTQSTFDSKQVIQSLAVGEIAGVPDASNGAATYTIPIPVPPGTNGVAPSISLEYSSYGDDGNLGVGWTLKGLSTITRAGNNPFYDAPSTVASHVKLNTEDKFLLDGQRLLLKSGVYGLHASTYGGEIEDFATVTALGGSYPNPVQWFSLKSKDGTLYEYGNTADSRIMSTNNSSILFWRLNKIIYLDGNYIEFKYVNTDADSRIDEINYTGNTAAGLLPYNKIKFHYAVRTDITTEYILGNPVRKKFLLEKVEIFAENLVLTKSFFLRYANNSQCKKSQLVELTERDGSGAALNSTAFLYHDASQQFSPIALTNIFGYNADWISLDANGDGLDDLVALEIVAGAPSSPDDGYYSKYWVYTKNLTGNDYTLSATVNLAQGSAYRGFSKHSYAIRFAPSDFNGDGAEDIITYNTFTYNQTSLQDVRVYLSPTTGNLYPAPIILNAPAFPENRLPTLGKEFLLTGDFDGNGKTDIVTILKNANTGNPTVRIIYGGTNIWFALTIPAANVPEPNISDWSQADNLRVLDFNGDGKEDILVVKGNFSQILTLSSPSQFTKLYEAGYPTKYHLLYTADFNGDGKTDILARTNKDDISSLWYKAISTGAGFVESQFIFYGNPVSIKPNVNANYEGDKVFCRDFNGDGLSDVQLIIKNASSIPMYLYTANGDLFNSVLPYTHNGSGSIDSDTKGVLSSNPDGDGVVDLFYRFETSNAHKIGFCPDNRELILKKVKSGFGRVSEWSYKKPTEGSPFYVRGNLTVYPINNVTPRGLFVSEFKTDNGIGATSNSTFTYSGLKVHRVKGALGFEAVESSNLTLGIRTRIENELTTAYALLLPKKVQLFSLGTGSLLEETVNTNSLGTLGGGRMYFTVTNKVNNSVFQNRVTTSTFGNDNFGNITSSSTTDGVETTSTASEFNGYYGSPVPARPTSVTTTVTRSGQPSYAYTSKYTYNGIGQMITKTDFFGLPKAVTTTYGYHALGYQNSVSIATSGLTTRTTTSLYESKGRFLKEMTNALGQKEEYTYDAKWGKALTVKGVDGLTSTLGYDSFGRLISTTSPTGAVSTVTFGWDINTTDRTVYYQRDWIAGKPDIVTFYDLLGRKTKTWMSGFGSDGWILTKTTYDARGNVLSETRPYKSTETPFITSYEYDAFPNRVKKVTNPFGNTQITYAYAANGNLTTTTTDPAGFVSSSVSDVSGRKISSTDNGGTLTYSYYSHGNLYQVKNGSIVLTTSEYDAYARQNKLIDINAGTSEYEYNALGELVLQKSALQVGTSSSTIQQYDVLGRPTVKTGQEGVTTNEYFPTGSGSSTGKIKKIIGFSGETDEYTYDSFGRIATKKVTVDGTPNTTSYAYTIYNDIDVVTYPTGFGVKYTYDGEGYNTSIKNSTQTITLCTPNSFNGYGQATGFSLGNGKSSTITYDNGIPTRYLTAGVQDLTLNWNYQTGNLNFRYDAIKNKTENFTYDNLNRLKTTTVVGQTAITTIYSNNGNITSKSDLGTYSYGTSRINAVTNINPSGLPTTQQDIIYTPFSQPSKITEGVHQLDYTYAANQERIKGVSRQSGAVTNTRYYFESFEKNVSSSGVATNVHYVPLVGNTAAIVVQQNGLWSYYYSYSDHLGSLLRVTNSSGSIIAEQDFDAWGRIRNVNTWNYVNPTNSLQAWLYRGFTGHEAMPLFGLVNMNRRLYEPITGRMLSPDNLFHGTTQGANRFSYAHNNPLKYVDLDGEHPLVIYGVAALVGGGINMYANWRTGDWKHNLASFGVGAGAGVIAAYAGPAFASGIGLNASVGVAGGAASGAAASATSNLYLQIGNTLIGNQNSFDAKQYTFSFLFGGVTGGIFGGVMGLYNNSLAKKDIANNLDKIRPPVNIWTGQTAKGGSNPWSFRNQPNLSKLNPTATGNGLHTIEFSESVDANTLRNSVNQKYLVPVPAAEYPALAELAGKSWSRVLPKGTVLTRYGDASGRWASPQGTSFGARSIPYRMIDEYHEYILNEPLEVIESLANPGPHGYQHGMGVQWRLPNTIDKLDFEGILSPLKI